MKLSYVICALFHSNKDIDYPPKYNIFIDKVDIIQQIMVKYNVKVI